MMTNNPTKKINRSTALILGLFLFSIYLLVYRGGFHSVDEVSMFAVTESLAKFGQANTNQIAWTQWTTTQAEAQGFFGWNGQVYSKKGLALSLAQLPLYWLAMLMPGLGMLQTVSLLNGLVTAVSGMLVFLFVRRLGYGVNTALTAALTFGLATIAFVYAKYLFSEPLAGFLLLLAAYMLFAFRQEGGLRHVAIAGLTAGFAVLARANNLFLLPVFALYLLWVAGVQGNKVTSRKVVAWRNFIRPDTLKPVAAFIGALAIPGFVLLSYNFLRSGNPLQTGYDLTLFSPNILLGFYKLLFSPLRGLFVYSPILLMSLPGWWQLRRAHPAEAWLFAGLTGITVGLFSAWSSGEGLSWGSRFLVPVVPFFAISLAPVMEQIIELPKRKQFTILLYALLPLSLLIQLLGVTINPWVYLAKVQANFGGEFFLERTAALYNFGYSQIAGQLQSWSVQNSDLIWWQPRGFDAVAFGISATLVVLTSWSLAQAVREKSPWLRRALVPLLIASALVTLFLLTRYYATDRQFGPPTEPYTAALNQVAGQAAPADKIITVAPYHYHVPMNRFTTRLPLIGMAQQTWPLPETALPLLKSAITGANLWLVTIGFPPAAADNAAERWLAQNAFPAGEEWIDDVRLLRYGTRPPATTRPIDISLGQNITLTQIRLLDALPGGQVLPMELTWLANEPPAENYQVFIQLLTADGALAVQRDGPPNGGYTPATDWPINQPLTDRHGLALPADLPPGDYRLIAGLYNPATGQRLITNTGTDFIELGTVAIERGK